MIEIRLNRLIIFLSIVIIICISSAIAFYYSYIIKHVAYWDMDVTTGSRIGFNIDPDAMHFGIVPPEAYSKGELIVLNPYEHKTRVLVDTRGNISRFVTISDSDFILKPGQNKTITFVCIIPTGMPEDLNYTGKARFIFKREI